MIVTLAGLDSYAQQQRLAALLAGRRPAYLLPDASVGQWQERLGQSDLFGETAPVVVEGALKLAADAQQALVPLLAPQLSAEQLVVLRHDGDKLPARGKLVELVQQGTVEYFPLPTQGQVVTWIREEAQRLEFEVEKPAAVQLALLFGGNRVALATELAKWSLRGGALTLAEVSRIGWQEGEVEVFGLTESWARRQLAQCLAQLHELARQDTSPHALLALLERQARLLYLVILSKDERVTPAALSQQLGVPSFVISKLVSAAASWRKDQVEQALVGLFRLDWALKTGQIEGWLGLELFVVGSLQAEPVFVFAPPEALNHK